MEQIAELKSILSNLDKMGPSHYFIDFMQNESFEVGILRLLPGQKDIQDTHSSDEFYFVVAGNGKIRVSHTDHAINKGSCIFVPANTNHYFHSNEDELIVLYVFRS